ncbi:MAG: ribonuclease E/G, partial [Qipengyuania sp.]
GTSDDGDGKPRKRRRRGGRGRRGGKGRAQNSEMKVGDSEKLEDVAEQVEEDMAVVAGPDGAAQTAEAMADEQPKPKKRAPRRNKAEAADAGTEEKPKPKRVRKKKGEDAPAEGNGPQSPSEAPPETPPEKPKRATARKPAAKARKSETQKAEAKPTPDAVSGKAKPEKSAGTVDAAKPRRGWWQRTFGEGES